MKRNIVLLFTFATLIMSFGSRVTLAQTAPAAAKAKKAEKAPEAFDPHDLTGTWDPVNLSRNLDAVPVYGTLGKDVPPRTPWAQAQYDKVTPSYGPKAVANGDDPIFDCIPTGIPRIFFFPQPFRFVQSKGETIQFFEREHTYREIFTDGRSHPKEPEPTWMGDAIGKWDGDTFVIDSVGFNDRAWMDFWGNPRSEQLHLIERWKRVDQYTISMQITAEDPGAYTKTWVGDTKLAKLSKEPMEELPCITEEEHAFRDRIRMRAVHGEGAKDAK